MNIPVNVAITQSSGGGEGPSVRCVTISIEDGINGRHICEVHLTPHDLAKALGSRHVHGIATMYVRDDKLGRRAEYREAYVKVPRLPHRQRDEYADSAKLAAAALEFDGWVARPRLGCQDSEKPADTPDAVLIKVDLVRYVGEPQQMDANSLRPFSKYDEIPRE